MPDLNTETVEEQQVFYLNRPAFLKKVFERGGPYLYHIVDELERLEVAVGDEHLVVVIAEPRLVVVLALLLEVLLPDARAAALLQRALGPVYAMRARTARA